MPGHLGILQCMYYGCRIDVVLHFYLQGANFRSLKGIIIKEDGITVDIVREPREYLSSGKPLVKS